MEARRHRTELEEKIAAALRKETGEWTPDCLEPDVMLGLIQQGGTYPEAARLLAHLAQCAYCQEEYDATRQIWRLAQQANTTRETVPTPTSDAGEEPASAPVVSTGIPEKRSFWRWLLGPSVGFACGAAVLLLIYVVGIYPRMAALSGELTKATQQRETARQEAAVQMRQTQELTRQITGLQQEKTRLQTELKQRPMQIAATDTALIQNALQNGLRIPAPLAASTPPQLRDGSGPELQEIRLIQPLRITVAESRPTLLWEALPGVTAYRVMIVDAQGNTLVHAVSSETAWTPPRDLPRGQVLEWQVEGMRAEATVGRSAIAKIRILDAEQMQALIRATLAQGIRYAQVGLTKEARATFAYVLRLDPQNAAARKLLPTLSR